MARRQDVKETGWLSYDFDKRRLSGVPPGSQILGQSYDLRFEAKDGYGGKDQYRCST